MTPHMVGQQPNWPERPQVVLVGNPRARRHEVTSAVAELERFLTGGTLADVAGVDLDGSLDLSSIKADLILNVGGDGSLLSLARRMHTNQIPVAGINFGKFGFLAEFEYEDFYDDLTAILTGYFQIRERSMIGGQLMRGETQVADTYALNDLVISRSHYSRIAQLEVWYDHHYCTNYHADGLILATPAGSTAHSLSAGGPILMPNMDAYVITPICPHTLTVRPLVVPAGPPIRVAVAYSDDRVALIADGQDTVEMELGDELIVYKPAQPFRLIRSGRRTFFETMRRKLNWAGHGNIRLPKQAATDPRTAIPEAEYHQEDTPHRDADEAAGK